MNLSDRVNQRINNSKKLLQWLEEVLLAVDEPEKLEIIIGNNEIKAVCADPPLAHEVLIMASVADYQKLISVYIGNDRYGGNHPYGWG